MVDAGTLYTFAHLFYWDFRRIVEGHTRWKYDETEYKQLETEIDSHDIQLNRNQKIAIAKAVRKEIADGSLPEARRISRLRELGRSNVTVTREWLRNEAADSARKPVQVPGKPEVIEAMLRATTEEELRNICKDAFLTKKVEIAPGVEKELNLPNWPIPVGSILPGSISEYARQILAAKNDSRFPKSTDRPTSQWKQLWFLSRALAGALYSIQPRTAVNLIGSVRPEETFARSNDAKSARKQAKISVRRRSEKK